MTENARKAYAYWLSNMSDDGSIHPSEEAAEGLAKRFDCDPCAIEEWGDRYAALFEERASRGDYYTPDFEEVP
jgi:hypothetical protein